MFDAAVVLLVGAIGEAKQHPRFRAIRISLDGRRGASDCRPQIASPERRGALAHVVVLQGNSGTGRGRPEFSDRLLEVAFGQSRKRLHVRGWREQGRDARRLPQQSHAHERRSRWAGRSARIGTCRRLRRVEAAQGGGGPCFVAGGDQALRQTVGRGGAAGAELRRIRKRERGVSRTFCEIVGEAQEDVGVRALGIESPRGLGFLERFASVATLQVHTGQGDVRVGGPLRHVEQHRAICPDGLVPSRQRACELIDGDRYGVAVAARRVGDGFNQLPDGSDELIPVALELRGSGDDLGLSTVAGAGFLRLPGHGGRAEAEEEAQDRNVYGRRSWKHP